MNDLLRKYGAVFAPDNESGNGGEAETTSILDQVAGDETSSAETADSGAGSDESGSTILGSDSELGKDQEKPDGDSEAPAEYVDDPEKTKEENDAARKAFDEAKAKSDDETKDEYFGAPEGDYEFPTIEGYELNGEMTGEFSKFAKDRNYSQKQVTELANFQIGLYKKQAEARAEMVKNWGAECRRDKEIGGQEFNKNAGIARQFRNSVFSNETRALLEKSGLGNHPALVKDMVRAGKAMGEGLVLKGGGKAEQEDAASILYPERK